MKIAHLGELIGKRVVVTADAGTVGYMVAERHLTARRIGAVGTVEGAVPGHGGDVVYIRQEDTPPKAEPVAVYCHYVNELEFYSDEALAFAQDKAKHVKVLEQQLNDLKRAPFKALASI